MSQNYQQYGGNPYGQQGQGQPQSNPYGGGYGSNPYGGGVSNINCALRFALYEQHRLTRF
jgi:hypothetical protein